MRAGAHSRGVQQSTCQCGARGVCNSRWQVRDQGVIRLDGGRMAPQRRRTRAHAQTETQHPMPSRACDHSLAHALTSACARVNVLQMRSRLRRPLDCPWTWFLS
eukprot:5363571-Pleurochrysis_carterae.AAC.9